MRLTMPHSFAAGGVESLLLKIVTEYQKESPGYTFALRAHMTEVLLMIIRQLLSLEDKNQDSKIARAYQAIKYHPDRAWSVVELADLCGYQADYFAELFKLENGKTPKQFLMEERNRKAKYLLLSGETLENITKKLAYTSLHYFSRSFKEENGMTPTQYRQQGEPSP